MTPILILLCFIFTYQRNLPIKARLVIFEYEMSKAKFIGHVRIESCDEKGIFSFRSLEFKDTIKSAKTALIFSNYRYIPLDTLDYWSNYSPKINDTVLIVIDSIDRISLCAKLVGEDYRFWSPHQTTSSAFFEFKSPARKLKENHFQDNRDIKSDFITCWDGCLLHKDSLAFYRKDILLKIPKK